MSSSRLSYKAEYDLMDQALKTEKGVRSHIGSREASMLYRLKLNKARQLDRKTNAEAYQPGHILHGGSEYDELVFTVREDTEGEWWVYLEKAMVPTLVEPIE
jgi:hypothetical protein